MHQANFATVKTEYVITSNFIGPFGPSVKPVEYTGVVVNFRWFIDGKFESGMINLQRINEISNRILPVEFGARVNDPDILGVGLFHQFLPCLVVGHIPDLQVLFNEAKLVY